MFANSKYIVWNCHTGTEESGFLAFRHLKHLMGWKYLNMRKYFIDVFS